VVARPRPLKARFVLGGEEWLEEPRLDLLAHSAAVIGDRDQNVLAGRNLGGFGRRFALWRNLEDRSRNR
jgi:hypothetical protein